MLRRAVVIGAEGYHFSQTFADYARPDNEPMYIFSDGAAAALLETDRDRELPNWLGAFHFMVDSSHYPDVPIPAGGAKNYHGSETSLMLPGKDAQSLKRFGIQYIRNYLTVIARELEAEGRGARPDFLISSQLKLPLMRILLSKLDLDMDHTVYTMPRLGHMGTADILLALGEALDGNKPRPGSATAIVSSGVSFSWGAATLLTP
jgi:3-oxoacyl-[acyl-carrier-protein] synthase III